MIPVLLIGCGRFGKNYLRILKALELKKEVSIVSVISKEGGIPGVNNSYELTDELMHKARAAFIVTPTSTHYELTKRCLPHMHVLVEKPMAFDIKQMNELSSLAAKNDKMLMVGHIYRFNEAIKKIRQEVESGTRFRIRFLGGSMPNDSDALHEYLHAFDILDYLFGELVRVRCDASDYKSGRLSYGMFRLDYENDNSGVLEIGFRGDKERTLVCDTLRGSIELDLVKQTIRNGDFTTSTLDYEPLAAEIGAFLRLVRGERFEYPDAMLAVRIEMVINKVLNSAIR